MAALWFKTSALLSLLLFMPFSYAGMVDGFQDGKQAKHSLAQSLSSALGAGRMTQIQMSSSRKLLTMMMMTSTNAMLDYDDTGANPKHDPRRKPGKP